MVCVCVCVCVHFLWYECVCVSVLFFGMSVCVGVYICDFFFV